MFKLNGKKENIPNTSKWNTVGRRHSVLGEWIYEGQLQLIDCYNMAMYQKEQAFVEKLFGKLNKEDLFTLPLAASSLTRNHNRMPTGAYRNKSKSQEDSFDINMIALKLDKEIEEIKCKHSAQVLKQ